MTDHQSMIRDRPAESQKPELEPLPLQTIEPGCHCTIMVALPGSPPFSFTARFGDTDDLRDALVGPPTQRSDFVSCVSITGEIMFVPLARDPLVVIQPVRVASGLVRPGPGQHVGGSRA